MHNEWERLSNSPACYSDWNSDKSPSVWLWATLKDSPSSSTSLIQQWDNEYHNYDGAIVPLSWYSEPKRQSTKVFVTWLAASGFEMWTERLDGIPPLHTSAVCERTNRFQMGEKKPLMCHVTLMYVCGEGWRLCSSDVIWKTCCFITIITVCVCVFFFTKPEEPVYLLVHCWQPVFSLPLLAASRELFLQTGCDVCNSNR